MSKPTNEALLDKTILEEDLEFFLENYRETPVRWLTRGSACGTTARPSRLRYADDTTIDTDSSSWNDIIMRQPRRYELERLPSEEWRSRTRSAEPSPSHQEDVVAEVVREMKEERIALLEWSGAAIADIIVRDREIRSLLIKGYEEVCRGRTLRGTVLKAVRIASSYGVETAQDTYREHIALRRKLGAEDEYPKRNRRKQRPT